MNTADEMYKYAVEKGFGTGWNKTWGVKHFNVIERNLMPKEQVLMTFIGLHNYISVSKHDGNFAYAITNKRFIMGQKHLLFGEKIQTVYLEYINDITFKSGIALGTLTIDTIKEIFNVGMDKISAQAISEEIHKILDKQKHSQSSKKESLQTSTADEILKYKNLLDIGAISPEEFEKQKNKLLNK